LGLRADTTPQVARIDAHLLNRQGVTRLCYCGPVVHTRIDRPHATREPLQFGAELYGHAGREADLEIMELALASLRSAGAHRLQIDLGDVRLVDAVLSGLSLSTDTVHRIHTALAAKDVATLRREARALPAHAGSALVALTGLYGGRSILAEARSLMPGHALWAAALDDLEWMAGHLAGVDVGFDLADMRGYSYYTGMRFSVFGGAGDGALAELARGGRYDEVGAVFGRRRPAAGFSLDVKTLVSVVPRPSLQSAIRAPWGDDAALRSAVAELRARGETVVCMLPGHDQEVDEFECDRVLVERNGVWVLQPLAA